MHPPTTATPNIKPMLETKQMKTLKQIIHDKKITLNRFTLVLTDNEIQECVKKWLQQKRIQYNNFPEKLYNELLKELNQ